jgi:hypothetical protein
MLSFSKIKPQLNLMKNSKNWIIALLVVIIAGGAFYIFACDGKEAGPNDEPKGPPPAEITLENDFTPPTGSAGTAKETPGARRIMSAYSDDGLTWTKTNKVITDQADVGEIVIDEKGIIYLYYYGWTVGDKENIPAMAISQDNGETWTFKNMSWEGFPNRGDLADPDLLYENGIFRLYGSTRTPDGFINVAYGESTDGINFEYKGLAFEMSEGMGGGVASTHYINDQYHLLSLGALGQPGEEHGLHWYATSKDGNVFEYIEKVFFTANNHNYHVGNAIPMDEGMRLYLFTPAGGSPILSWFSTNGKDWELEEGNRLELDEDSGLEKGYLGEPDVLQLPDGRYFMTYSTFIP